MPTDHRDTDVFGDNNRRVVSSDDSAAEEAAAAAQVATNNAQTRDIKADGQIHKVRLMCLPVHHRRSGD